jgi:hypothetical protein
MPGRAVHTRPARTSERETVGAAIRNTRLKLLERGNPLGLVYVPFALAGLAIDEEALIAA